MPLMARVSSRMTSTHARGWKSIHVYWLRPGCCGSSLPRPRCKMLGLEGLQLAETAHGQYKPHWTRCPFSPMAFHPMSFHPKELHGLS
jgi:hypothetical protein